MRSSISRCAGYERDGKTAAPAIRRELREDAELWTGLLGPPILWLIQFQTIYAIAGWGCELHSKLPLFLVSGFILLLAIATGVLASRYLRKPGAEPEAKRARFLARVGIMSAALFSLVIIAQAIATIMLSPCME